MHEIIEGSASQLVHLHQVLEVGDLSLLPAMSSEDREGWEEREEGWGKRG